MRYQKKEEGSKNVNPTKLYRKISGQNKVFVQDMLKNEPLPP